MTLNMEFINVHSFPLEKTRRLRNVFKIKNINLSFDRSKKN